MATIQLKAGMVWKGAYDASVPYDKLDVVCNADKTQIAVCKQGGSGIPLTNSNYWEVSIDASGIIALLEDALAHGEIYTMKIGSVTTGATSSATIVNNHQTHETSLNLVLEKGEKGDKGDKGDRGEKGDTVIIGEGEEYTLYNELGEHTDGAMTQAAVTEEFEKLDEEYARNDGYYETMGVGMATNLKGQNAVDAEFTYRKSGGNVEVQDGNAMIEAIKGNTLAWNQLLENSFGRSTSLNGVTLSISNLTVSVSGTATGSGWCVIYSSMFRAIKGHKFLCFSNNNNSVFRIYKGSGSTVGINTIFSIDESDYTYPSVYVTNGITYNETNTHVNIFDLTLIYGEGNEPATVEQFEQDYFNWFGKPLTYEPYDAGSLRNTKVSALKTVGFNLWDEEWELGAIDSNTGELAPATNQYRSKNFIKVASGQAYCARFTRGYLTKFEYDKNFNFIQGSYSQSNVSPFIFTTKQDCEYIKINNWGGDIPTNTVYNHDICINLSDPNRNGEYEPYKESTLPFDVTTLTGKLNGEGSSVVVFADGMNSAGDVHDEIKIENGVVKAIKRVGSVDLGSVQWIRINTRSNWCFWSGWGVIQRGTASKKYTNAKYIIGNVGASVESATGNDKTLRSYIDGIYIKDTSYTDHNDFGTANQGVMLYYELAEPEVYVLDDFNLPKLYPVANGGTEEQLSNSSNSLPATLSIRYGLNAAAFIQNAPKNYISKESMSNFLGNLGSAMGGTWTMTWNSSTNKYDFSFTQNRSVDVEQPIEDK